MNAIVLNTCERSLNHVPLLRQAALRGDARFFAQFGGQGNSFLPELRRLYAENESLRPFFEACFDALRDAQLRPDAHAARDLCYPHGFDLRDWLRGRNVPPESALSECTLSFPGTMLAQLAHLYLISLFGYPLADLARHSVACTGHSQGILAASAFALGVDSDGQPHEVLQMCYEYLHWFAVAGFFVKTGYARRTPSLPAVTREFSYAIDGTLPRPMAVIFGPGRAQLDEWLSDFNRHHESTDPDLHGTTLSVALINGPTVHVLAGHASDLCEFRRFTLAHFPPDGDYDWEYVPVTAPFHSAPHMRQIVQSFTRDPVCANFRYQPSDLKIPVISFVDGHDLRDDAVLGTTLAEALLLEPLDWDQALNAMPDDGPDVTHVIDFGPGRVSATLTRGYLERAEAGRDALRNENSAAALRGLARRAGPTIEVISTNRSTGLRRLLD
jgi:malonyl CoA-acyl carrier protein transacylase